MTTPYEYLNARHGESCATKLTEAEARQILERRRQAQKYAAEAKSLSNTALAEKFGISHKAVGRIINNKRWGENSRGRKTKHLGMTMEDAELIRQAAKERDRLKSLAAEHSIKKLATEYGVSESLIEMIGNGSRWIYLQTTMEA